MDQEEEMKSNLGIGFGCEMCLPKSPVLAFETQSL